MIKFFHKYQQSVIGILFLAIISLAMLFFGLPTGPSSRSQYAIKVNETEVYLDEVSRRKRELKDRYRSMFGQQYSAIAPQLEKNLPTQVVNTIIDELLLRGFAIDRGFVSGQKPLTNFLSEQLGGFSPDKYAGFLRQVRMTAPVFEERLASDFLQSSLEDLMRDVSFASEDEVKDLFLRERTSLDLRYFAVDPAGLQEKVEVKPEVLEAYFEENIASYELPRQVKYGYVKVDPAIFESQVEVFDEDIDLYYTSNQKRFRIPAERRVRIIRFKKDGEEKKEDLEALAKEVRARFEAGESAEELAKLFSEDDSKDEGGLLGWKKRGELSIDIEKAAFELEAAGLREIESGDDRLLVFVEDVKLESVKPLEEVKAEIEDTIRKREAPSYASALSEELLAEWQASEKSLQEFAEGKENLTYVASSKLFSDREDPTGLAGLSREVISRAGDKQQLARIRTGSVLVELEEFLDRRFPSFEDSAEQVEKKYREREALTLARAKASELSEKFRAEEAMGFEDIAKAEALEIKSKKAMKRNDASGNPFSDEAVRAALFDGGEQALKQSFEVAGSFYFFEVEKRDTPNLEEAEEDLKQFRKRAEGQLFQEFRTAMINRVKANSEVDISPFAYN